jgi:hypothetical protein
MFGLAERKVDLPLWLKVDSHWHDQMNFFCSKVANATTPINQSLVVDMEETSGFDLVITCNGVEVFECLCGGDIWQIERCPLKLSSHYLALQKDIKHYYKAKIISKQTNHGILAPCYVGY